MGALPMLCGILLGATAQAQTISAPPPIFSVVDANGVNLATGTFNVTANEFTVGRKQGSLSYARWFIQSGWTDSTNDVIAISGSTYTVSFGGRSESFTLSGGVYSPAQGQGSTLTYNSTTNLYTYTAEDGTVVVFQFLKGQTSTGFGTYAAATSTTPDGVVTTFSWQQGIYCFITSPCPGQQQFAIRLMGLTNNLGWSLIKTYQSNTLTLASQLSAWLNLTNVVGVNGAKDDCFPAMTCGTLSTTYPSATLARSGVTLTDADALGRTTTYTYSSATGGVLVSIEKPSGLTVSVTYNGSNQVHTVANGTGTWTYGYSAVGSTETTTATDPLGHVHTYVANLNNGEITSVTDYPTSTTSRTTSYGYDTFGRLNQVTYPLGDVVKYAYDGRGNLNTVTHVPVSGSGLSNVVASASFDSTCTNPVKCNKPNSITDANGKVTNLTYDPTYGVVTTVDPPLAATGATQSETRNSYTQLYAYYYIGGVIAQAPSAVHMLTGASTCQTEAPAACPGTVDEVKTSITYGSPGSPNNLLATSVSEGSGNGSLTATTSQSYDQAGDIATHTGALGASQKTVYVYDYDRERIGVFGPEASSTTGYPTMRTTYNSDGLITEVENGSDTSQTDSTFATFTSLQQRNTVYDGLDRVSKRTFTAASTTYNVTQLTYDNANRLSCTAVRMNPAVFGSLPSSACTLGAEGSNGNDRVSQNTYDDADQLTGVGRRGAG